jgi:hypothetical protein
MGWCGVDKIILAQDTDKCGPNENLDGNFGSIKCGEFLD